jgi:hypothetical protein
MVNSVNPQKWVVLFIGLMYVTFLPFDTKSQDQPHVRISGTVIDASTGTPLHLANVFLSETTMGAATDEQGQFIIINIPWGTYELVATMMGYEPHIIKIHLPTIDEKDFIIKLRQKAISLPAVEISAPRPKEWRKNLKTFEDIFLGKSNNARKCKIINPEVLDFTSGTTPGSLNASAEDPLEIENNALGYRILYYMEAFVFDDRSILWTTGHASFESLHPKNQKEEKRWVKNRLKAFYGSRRHFFRALISDRLEEEGFYVTHVSSIHKHQYRGADLIRINAEEILAQEPNTPAYEGKLFFQDYLMVIYTKEYASQEYVHAIGRDVQYRRDDFGRSNKPTSHTPDIPQVSFLRMNQSIPALINASGLIDNPKSIMTYGYWAWERFAEQLPLDYSPEE